MDSELQLAEARRFRRTMRLWPFLRPIVGRGLSRRCRRCVISERHGPLDASGLCHACAGHVPGPAPIGIRTDPDPFDALLRAGAGRATGAYDALVLLSGGKDSAYLLHRLRHDHPRLRLLTLLVDNGFMSRLALANVDALCAGSGIAHITLRLPAADVRQVFRSGLIGLARQTGYSIVDLLDAQMTFDAALRLAADLGIPSVIAGLSRTQAVNVGLPEWTWPVEGFDLPAVSGFAKRLAHPDPDGRLWYAPERIPAERRPRFLVPFALWDPGESFILAEVTRLGLLPAGNRDPILTNNALIPVIGLAEVARFGFSSFEVEFAREVRDGKSDRAVWLSAFEMLEFAATTGRFLGAGVTATLAELGLSPGDLGISRST